MEGMNKMHVSLALLAPLSHMHVSLALLAPLSHPSSTFQINTAPLHLLYTMYKRAVLSLGTLRWTSHILRLPPLFLVR